ncbi:MAG: tRNA (adenosine(37)-N6)-threonylcarbamoyltransferase complex ATPase subunit type 1 TsaE [Opitutae bacterium]|nr:tRNA (adenosine(37)-N6)-threonylcarbamoyltransferase complex ATPase subunit type 1 TsaE [Opitutae bacterium]|tara:strand:+ start:299 stop:727 length:429 start_codon:yes stop_codon:yes gene_type:complete
MINQIIPCNKDYTEIARTIYKAIKNHPKIVIFLNGSMGSGKTTFARTLTRFYGSEAIQSASFGLVNKLPGKNNIIHCDFYRCSLNEEFLDTEITPLLGDEFLLLIEWCSPQILDVEADHYCFEINALKDGNRSITFSEISSE